MGRKSSSDSDDTDPEEYEERERSDEETEESKEANSDSDDSTEHEYIHEGSEGEYSESSSESSEESEEDYKLTDNDFIGLVGDPSYTEASVVTYQIPSTENTLVNYRCTHSACNRIIGSMSLMFEKEIENAQMKCRREHGRNMSTDEYNLFVDSSYDNYNVVFEKGALDRSATIYDKRTMELISDKQREFYEKNKRRMTQDEYNDMIDSLTVYEEGNTADKLKKIKELFFSHFSRRMSLDDYESYMGDSNTNIGKIMRLVFSNYTSDLSKKEYNLVLKNAFEKILVQESAKEFILLNGRTILDFMKFRATPGAATRCASVNSKVLESECCRVKIMQTLIISKGRDSYNRGIVEEGIKHGNVVMERFPKPYEFNPFDMDEDLLSLPTVKKSKRNLINSKVVPTLSDFPQMPPDDDFEDEEFVPFAYKTKEKITHKIHTGVPGYVTYKISNRQIIAR